MKERKGTIERLESRFPRIVVEGRSYIRKRILVSVI